MNALAWLARVVGVGLMVGQAAAAQRTVTGRAPSLRPTPCTMEIPAPMKPRVQCFTFTVPRDYDHPEEGTFDLAVGIRAAAQPNAARRPFLVLHGGPGNTGFVSGIGIVGDASPGATMIAFDQRGMGLSAPRDACSDIASTWSEAIAGPGDAFTTAWRAQEPMARCRALLERIGVKAQHFGTRVTSRDAEELRRALRIARWDVYSVSYGTVVARDLLAAYPDGIGSVILDSPVPLHGVPPGGAERMDWTMRNIFAACAADTVCATVHADFESRFLETFDSVDAHHLVVPIPEAKIPGVTVADINGAELDFLVRRLRRGVATMGSIPRVMRAARNRDIEALRPFVARAVSGTGDEGVPGQPSILCRDVPEFHKPTLPRTAFEMINTRFCGVWGAPGQPARMPRAGASRVLMLIGGLDVLVEQSLVDSIKASLRKQAQAIVFPALGHGVTRTPCGLGIGAAFYANPDAELDTKCIEPRPRITFER